MSLVKSILIIEDNHDSRQLFGEILRDEDFNVIETEDGQEALDFLQDHSELPDLILMDLTFPKMTADEFVDQLNAHPEWQGIPLVVVSGQIDTQEHAMKLNAKGFLRKPFDIENLIRTVKDVSH